MKSLKSMTLRLRQRFRRRRAVTSDPVEVDVAEVAIAAAREAFGGPDYDPDPRRPGRLARETRGWREG